MRRPQPPSPEETVRASRQLPASPAVPALRWSEAGGYGLDAPRVEAALADGVAGFILFGGPAEAAREATRALARRAGRPLLFGADLERGAGQQFSGATPLPPLAALGDLGDLEVIREAAALTAREAVALGVPWVFAPVADLALEPENPIVATRAFGADPQRVGAQVAAWVGGCLSAGGIPCVKHFPGHGRTREDSHAGLPVVRASAEALEGCDLVPFRRALEAGVPSVMTAHVAFPALDAAGGPATASRPIVTGLLREAMGFTGAVVTDALIMEGAGEADAALAGALAAGVDLLLYPPDEVEVKEAIRRALTAGRLSPDEMEASRRRVAGLVARIPGENGGAWGRVEDRDRAEAWARRCLVPPVAGGWVGARGTVAGRGRPGVVLTVVDDDQGGPYPAPSREPFRRALGREGMAAGEWDGGAVAGLPGGESAPHPLPLLCVYAEPRAWKGRAGLSREARERVAAWAAATGGGEDDGGRLAVVFGGPRVAADLPPEVPVLLAWGGEPLMQEAAARWVAGALRGEARVREGDR